MRCLSGAGFSIAVYLTLAGSTALNKRPWCDETWYASPGWNLITNGYMGTSTLEPSSTTWKSVRLTGIDRHTYWAMPLHFLAICPSGTSYSVSYSSRSGHSPSLGV